MKNINILFVMMLIFLMVGCSGRKDQTICLQDFLVDHAESIGLDVPKDIDFKFEDVYLTKEEYDSFLENEFIEISIELDKYLVKQKEENEAMFIFKNIQNEYNCAIESNDLNKIQKIEAEYEEYEKKYLDIIDNK